MHVQEKMERGTPEERERKGGMEGGSGLQIHPGDGIAMIPWVRMKLGT